MTYEEALSELAGVYEIFIGDRCTSRAECDECRAELDAAIAAIRADAAAKERERVFAALFRDAEQMYGWTREETLDQFPRLAAIERGEHTEAPDG